MNLIDQKLWIYQKLYPPKDEFIELSVKFIHYSIEFIETLHSSKDTINLRAGTKGFTCGKWFTGYNFGKDDGAKFGTYKELIVLNIIKFKYFVNITGDMSPDHAFAKNRK